MIQNLDTNYSASASAEQPLALESVSFAGSGDEAFFAMRQVQGFSGNGETDAVAFFYTPISNNLAGDFDADGDVDGADWLKWQSDRLAIPDLLLWLTNYGANSGGIRGIGNPVPEKSTMALYCCALLAASPISRRAAAHGSQGGSFF